MLLFLAILKDMTQSIRARLLPFVLSIGVLSLHASDTPTAIVAGDKPLSSLPAETNAFRWAPEPEDGKVAFVTARLLERMQFSHHRFDDTISSEFLDRYLDSLDYQHLHFLQSDLDEFESYRTNLDHLTLNRTGTADTSPAFKIYSCFVERVRQRQAYAQDLLLHDDFKFDSDEKIAVNRHEMPYPKDLTEAKQLWRQRLRYEYLVEKLGLEQKDKAKSADTNSADAKPAEGKSVRQQITETLTHRYARVLRMYKDFNHEDILGIYLTALAHVYDPH